MEQRQRSDLLCLCSFEQKKEEVRSCLNIYWK